MICRCRHRSARGRHRSARGLLALSLAAIALAACDPPSTSCGPHSATVVNIVDGDTVDLDTGDRIRYLLVDTPELSSSDCYAQEATELNAELVLGKEVQLRYDAECTDRFGRTLAYVSVDGREINSLLVERGYGCVLHIPPNGADRVEEFENLEQQARLAPRGMWGACEEVTCAN